jgi:hypothetical protein
LLGNQSFQVGGSSRRDLPRWAKYVAFVVVTTALVGGLLYRRSTQPSDEQVVMRFERSGPRVQQDDDLIAYLAGSEPPSNEIATAAFCVNGWYWATDVTLNTRVVVGGSDRLLRATELVADGSYSVGLVSAIESTALRNLDPAPVESAQVPKSVVEEYGAETVGDYLADVARPPATESRERFVLFAASASTSEQYIFVIDLDQLDRAAIKRFIDGGPLIGRNATEVVIAGTGEAIAVDDGMCHALL